MEDLEFRSGTYYIDEIRYSSKLRSYYVAMCREDRKGLMEFHVELDWSATNAPSIAAEIITPFHVSEFPTLLYKDS